MIQPILNHRDIPLRFEDAWNRYDANAIADLFFDNADFVNVTGKWWDNKTDIWKAHDFGFRVIFQNSKLEVLKIKDKLLNNDIAIIHARFRLTGQTEHESNKADIRETMFIFVAQKVDGEWLCISAQNTDIAFGKQTNIRDEKGELKPVSYREKLGPITKDHNEM